MYEYVFLHVYSKRLTHERENICCHLRVMEEVGKHLTIVDSVQATMQKAVDDFIISGYPEEHLGIARRSHLFHRS